jgi:hypothetical protein
MPGPARPTLAGAVSRAARQRLAAGFLLGLLTVAGCATTERGWTRPNTTEAEFNRDSYECAREAVEWSVTAPRIETKVNKDLYRACMRARGYQLVEGGAWRGFRD